MVGTNGIRIVVMLEWWRGLGNNRNCWVPQPIQSSNPLFLAFRLELLPEGKPAKGHGRD